MLFQFLETTRCHLGELFESRGRYHRAGHLLDAFLVFIISMNIIAIVLESVPELMTEYHSIFLRIELISVAVFSVEYLARLWSSVALEKFKNGDEANWKVRVRYFFSPLALIDLLAILPSLLMLFINLDLRFLRVIRLLRIFKMTRYSRALQLLLVAFKEEGSSLLAAFFLMAVILILASCGIYLIEHDVQPDKFGSIPAAMWWAMATLTTVGYGDVVPITPLGQVFGGLITILSMGMVAIPTGLLASGFSEQLRKRRSLYRDAVHECLEDGKLSRQDKHKLEALRYELGLSKQECKRVIAQLKESTPESPKYCSHCGHPV